MTCRRLIGTSWDLKPQICYWIYVTVIRPQIAYGALIWWLKATQSTVATKLVSLQRLACLCITGAFRSTPTVTLEVLLDLPPLEIFLKAEARVTAYRLIHTSNWRMSRRGTGHTLILN